MKSNAAITIIQRQDGTILIIAQYRLGLPPEAIQRLADEISKLRARAGDRAILIPEGNGIEAIGFSKNIWSRLAFWRK